MNEQRIGIIDIGSNSIRLVVYEQTAAGAHRVIDGSKRPARLSQKITADNRIDEETVRELAETLGHFRLLCAHHRTNTIRAVATAAVRNAVNGAEVLQALGAETGLEIELLPGEEEAGFGFLGMVNTMEVRDGFLIDIGGGSTEISLFKERTLVQSVSFPFGCVSLARKFAEQGALDEVGLLALEEMVLEAAERENWLGWSPGLPLIGVGGTIRSLAKIHQAVRKYPFPQTHNYAIPTQDADRLFETLIRMPLDKRRKFPGLSKDRVDLIVPGLAVLRLFQRLTGATEYRVCAAGLRDGLFFSVQWPERPRLDNVLDYSVRNTCALYPEAPLPHLNQVNRLSLQLLEQLKPAVQNGVLADFGVRAATLLDAASMLYRIGASIEYAAYPKHTFYLLANCSLNGMSHRENVLTAAIAAFRSRNRCKAQLEPFEALLQPGDIEAAAMLGSLLLLAVSLDRSETQSISRLETEISAEARILKLTAVHPADSLALEMQEVEEAGKEFQKLWGLLPELVVR
ncbi:Ppx/GppA family phosphatase [Paenibacillus pasadenensis]|uniref:Ppx/GppA phosphatase family protein n=1 Tax=Paenibacillus pasadenensis TaxID=217090 RepID=UPI00203C6ABC|nr:Ppx/GppA phosphatase family protein [Paenibacillus pasadenensis]MCM3746787.1 Ppx/GppA family phosphatase [Paenibacillus pasadenensis]